MPVACFRTSLKQTLAESNAPQRCDEDEDSGERLELSQINQIFNFLSVQVCISYNKISSCQTKVDIETFVRDLDWHKGNGFRINLKVKETKDICNFNCLMVRKISCERYKSNYKAKSESKVLADSFMWSEVGIFNVSSLPSNDLE